MPYLDGGDIDARHARTRSGTCAALLPLVEAGADVVVAAAHLLLRAQEGVPAARARAPAADAVAAATRDLFEYLAAAHAEGTLDTDVPGPRRRARSPTRCPATCARRTWATRRATCCSSSRAPRCSVVERCTAMDGTWAMKKEYYPISLQFARKAAQRDGGGAAGHVRDRLPAGRAADRGGARARSRRIPISLLREAYGLPEER